MEIILYKYGKRENSTARPTGGTAYQCRLKTDCSVVSPTIEIDIGSATAWPDYNYAFIDTFHRYYSISNITASPKRLGFYELSASSNGFKGYVDFNEGSLRYTYTTDDGLRIISTIADVFFLKTKTIINYKDTTKSTEMDGTMYQFELAPASSTATIKVMGIVHAKDLKYFINLTGSGAELIPTPNGFTIESENIRTTGVYRNWVDSTSSVVSTTDKYPFKSFNASIDLVNDSFSTSFMMGDSATVSATGSTYPDYSTY
jgi:hypothetical protein